jgi:ribosomal protein S18 acetylase RimI-like enzyme
MKFRRALAQDLTMIVPLFDEYRKFYKQESDLPAAREFLSKRLEKNESIIFIAEVGDSDDESASTLDSQARPCAGFVQLYPSFSSISMRPLWILNDLFVSSQFRRQNIAEELIRTSERFAQESGAKGLTLLTGIDNLAAQGLYSKLGWKRVTEYYSYSRYF